jgi:hypothetical protein
MHPRSTITASTMPGRFRAPHADADTSPGSLRDELDHPGGRHQASADRLASGPAAVEPPPVLFTSAQAAQLLQVRESWLRRRAAQRRVPCTFLGKHLRFSPADLHQITTDAARPAAGRRQPSQSGVRGRSPQRSPVRSSTPGHRPGSLTWPVFWPG